MRIAHCQQQITSILRLRQQICAPAACQPVGDEVRAIFPEQRFRRHLREPTRLGDAIEQQAIIIDPIYQWRIIDSRADPSVISGEQIGSKALFQILLPGDEDKTMHE